MKPRKIKANNFKVSGSQNHDYSVCREQKRQRTEFVGAENAFAFLSLS